VRFVCADFFNAGFKHEFDGIYADLCGVGDGIVETIRAYIKQRAPVAFIGTMCARSATRGWTIHKRVAAANTAAFAQLSVRREPKPKKGAPMWTVEGHNAAYRALYRGRCIVAAQGPGWDAPLKIVSTPIRPRHGIPWMLHLRGNDRITWQIELSDVQLLQTPP
jgi:hypothetical protein